MVANNTVSERWVPLFVFGCFILWNLRVSNPSNYIVTEIVFRIQQPVEVKAVSEVSFPSSRDNSISNGGGGDDDDDDSFSSYMEDIPVKERSQQTQQRLQSMHQNDDEIEAMNDDEEWYAGGDKLTYISDALITQHPEPTAALRGTSS